MNDEIKNDIMESFNRECDYISQIDAPDYHTSTEFQTGMRKILNNAAKKLTGKELANDQLHKNQTNEKNSPRKEVVLMPKYFRPDSSFKSGTPFKKVMIVAAAVVCVAAAGIFIRINNKPQTMSPVDSTGASSENSGNSYNFELSPIPEVRESFAEESNKLKSRTFDNVRFDEAYFSFTEANEFYSLEYQNSKTDFRQSPDEAYDYMCKQVDKLFPELFNDEQKAYEIRFRVILEDNEESLPDNIDPTNEEEVRKWLNERSKNAHYKYPTLEQYKKDYSGETTNPALNISNQNCYITMKDGVMWAYDKGDLAKRIESDIRLSAFDPLSQFPIVYRTENLESQKTFHLVSGDVSIAEAVKIANKCLSELELSSRKLLFTPVVQSVNVLDIGDGCFAFFFNIVENYKQLNFDTLLKDNSCWGVSPTYDSTHEINLGGDAVMYELGELTRFRLMTPFIYSDIGETNSYSSVIPLEKAAEIASNHLTDGMEFKAMSVSPVYKSFSEKDWTQYTDKERFEDRTVTVNPCWRFVLQPLTGSTDSLYYIFVDMVTGEVYSTVQQMQSDVEYE